MYLTSGSIACIIMCEFYYSIAACVYMYMVHMLLLTLPTLPMPYMTLCVTIRPRSEKLEILESQLILGLRDTIILDRVHG